MQADLAVWAGKLASGNAADRAQVKTKMRHWQADPDLAGVREPATLGKRSAKERGEWLALWKEVGALLERTTSP